MTINMFSKSLVFVCILAHFAISVSSFCSTYFQNDTEYPYKKYQPATAYDESDTGDLTTYQLPTGCSPHAMVMVVRHGARYYPTSDEEEKFQSLESVQAMINDSNAEMCPEDLEKIKAWQNWFNTSLGSDLTLLGYREAAGLGRRFSEAFPVLFADDSRYELISSDTHRSRESALSFRDNSYNSKNDLILNTELIRPDLGCTRYQEEVGGNETLFSEKEMFANGEVFVNMRAAVSKRLGIPEANIDINTLSVIQQEGCAEDEIRNGTNSPWCLAFTTDELKAFEYRDDMGEYMLYGFGTDLSYKLHCPTKRFILSALNDINNGSELNKFLFGHHDVILRMLADMKLIEPEANGPFKAEDYPERLTRTYQNSILAPLAGSIAFLVNECPDGKKLQVLHNEKKIDLPLDNPLSDGILLTDALEYFGYNDQNDCNWDELCYGRTPVTDPAVESTVNPTVNSTAPLTMSNSTSTATTTTTTTATTDTTSGGYSSVHCTISTMLLLFQALYLLYPLN